MNNKQKTFLPYHIGCSVWSHAEWVGDFFRSDAKPADFLTQYASVFNAVEGSTTFYQVPSKKLIQLWGEKTPDGFKFCFKFPREITHQKQLNNVEDDVLRFVELFDPIREKLGPFMIQLPPSFSPKDLNRLENIFTALPQSMSYSVEVRNLDFFYEGKHERNLNALLKSFNVDRVIFDTRKLHASQSTEPSIVEAQKKKPKVPIRFNTTANRPVVRYVGTNDILNNAPYLKEWALIVEDWIREGLHPYIFLHTPNKTDQPALCRYFHKLLSDLMTLPALPNFPAQKEDEQLGLF